MGTEMTDFQFRRLLQMVLTILKKSENLEKAIKDIEKLASKDESES